MNNAAVNADKDVFEYLFSILSGIYLGVELLSHMVIQFLRNNTSIVL